MSHTTLLFIMRTLIATLIGLFAFIIYTRFARARKTITENNHRLAIIPELESVLNAADSDYAALLDAYLKEAKTKIKSKTYSSTIEAVLLEQLEAPGSKNWQRALSISYELGFPQLCLSQIKSRLNRNIAFGCRKAGLYRYKPAIPDMLSALAVFSSDTQFQILMGLSRIGDVFAIRMAFDIINQYVIVNERAVFEILSAFSGDRHELFSEMIHSKTEYVSALFLKSMEKENVEVLIEEIMQIFYNGGKEMRIAAIRALMKMEKDAPAEQMIRALSDDDWEIRAMAAKALGVSVHPDAESALAAALRDSEWWVRQNAAAALLAYPDCDKLFLAVSGERDAYALDSMIHVLENTDKVELLSKIRSITSELTEESSEEIETGKLEDERVQLPV